MPTFTANLSTPFRGGEAERFKKFLEGVGSTNVRFTLHRQTAAWFRFDSPLTLDDLKRFEEEREFQVQFFDTEHEEAKS